MTERRVLASGRDRDLVVDLSLPDPLKGGDVYGWALDQAALLRARHFDLVDLSNVADEIEDLGRSDYRALETRLEIVLLHILKWEHQPQRRSRSGSDTIFEQRLQIEKILRQSPSLKARLEEVVAAAYGDARRFASRQTGLPLSVFADECPYVLAYVLDTPFEVDEP